MPSKGRNRNSSTALSLAIMALASTFGTPVHRAQAKAQSTEPSKPAKLFSSESTLEATLTAPWREFARKKKTAASYPATLDYTDPVSGKQHMTLRIEPRGITRLDVCKLPPIKLLFDKAMTKATPFRGNASLKLVTHCGNGERWEQYAVIEMLAYRIYNRITARSFRVRPLSITYVDSADASVDGPHFAFLIEDDSELAKRNDLEKLDIPKPRVSQLEPLENNRFSLFQYLIGNTDWAVLSGPSADRCCHNSELIGEKSSANVVAVPYDFDSSGLVDAHYAAPNAALPIRSNRERLYRGFCANNASLDVARRELLTLEAQLLDLVRSESRLTARNRQAALDYLVKGFDILRDDAAFSRNVTEKCRK